MHSVAEYVDIVKTGLKKLNIRKYQMAWLTDPSRMRIALKSRQIGFSWTFALEAVVTALTKNRNQLLGSASQDQSEVMIAYAVDFLELFGVEPISKSASKIVLPNGKYLKALPKNWRTIQGFAGDVYFDEFAWNADDVWIWRALIPAVTAVGGRVSVASTPFAKRGKFYDLWSKENKYSKHEIDIYCALADGMDKNGKTVDDFIQELKDLLDDPEFFPSAYECKFIDDKNSYIPLSLIESLMKLDQNENDGQKIWLGIDIGRHHDITDITAIGEGKSGRKEVRFNIALKKMSYDDQKKFILKLFRKHYIYKCYIDRTGLGDNLFENIRDVYPNKVFGVWFSAKSKEKMAKNLKRMLEKGDIDLLKDRECALHYSAIKRIATERGFKYDTEKGGRKKEYGHADKFWSLALAGYVFYKKKRKMKTKKYNV